MLVDAVTVADVDAVVAGKVGLDSVAVLAQETQEASYSPAFTSPIDAAYASNSPA